MATNLTQIANIIKGMAPATQKLNYETSGNTVLSVKEALHYPEERIVQQRPTEIADNTKAVSSNDVKKKSEGKSMEEFKKMMVKGRDYGELPGVRGNVLFKAGALKFLHYMSYRKQEELIDKTVEVSTDNAFISYTVKVRVIDENGEVVTEALGSCNSHEAKYIKKGASADNVLIAMASKRALVTCVKELLSK